jgi:hypothetical protein
MPLRRVAAEAARSAMRSVREAAFWMACVVSNQRPTAKFEATTATVVTTIS